MFGVFCVVQCQLLCSPHPSHLSCFILLYDTWNQLRLNFDHQNCIEFYSNIQTILSIKSSNWGNFNYYIRKANQTWYATTHVFTYPIYIYVCRVGVRGDCNHIYSQTHIGNISHTVCILIYTNNITEQLTRSVNRAQHACAFARSSSRTRKAYICTSTKENSVPNNQRRIISARVLGLSLFENKTHRK